MHSRSINAIRCHAMQGGNALPPCENGSGGCSVALFLATSPWVVPALLGPAGRLPCRDSRQDASVYNSQAGHMLRLRQAAA